MAAPLVERTTNDLVPASDHNDVKDYIEDGTYRVNTLSLNIGGNEIIDSSGNITTDVGTVDGIDIGTDVAANTAKVTNANHSGDATGDGALTLATVNSDVGSFTAADITVNAKGLVTAASSGSGGGVFKFERKLEGSVYTTTFLPITITDAEACTIDEIRIALSALPTGADFKVDVRLNGTATTDSIFTSDVEIEIATGESATNGVYQSGCSTAGSTVGTAGTTLDAARDDVVADDVLWIVITQVGSTLAGADFSIVITGA